MLRLGGGDVAGPSMICESWRTFQVQRHTRQSSSERDQVSHAEQRALARGLSHAICIDE